MLAYSNLVNYNDVVNEEKKGFVFNGVIVIGMNKRYKHTLYKRRSKMERWFGVRATKVCHRTFVAQQHTKTFDYTPLYRFLFASVGTPWEQVKKKLLRKDRPLIDGENRLGDIVFMSGSKQIPSVVCTDENTYFNSLIVDEHGILRVYAPEIVVRKLYPTCSCCSYTLNGVRFVKTAPANDESVIEYIAVANGSTTLAMEVQTNQAMEVQHTP